MKNIIHKLSREETYQDGLNIFSETDEHTLFLAGGSNMTGEVGKQVHEILTNGKLSREKNKTEIIETLNADLSTPSVVLEYVKRLYNFKLANIEYFTNSINHLTLKNLFKLYPEDKFLNKLIKELQVAYYLPDSKPAAFNHADGDYFNAITKLQSLIIGEIKELPYIEEFEEFYFMYYWDTEKKELKRNDELAIRQLNKLVHYINSNQRTKKQLTELKYILSLLLGIVYPSKISGNDDYRSLSLEDYEKYGLPIK